MRIGASRNATKMGLKFKIMLEKEIGDKDLNIGRASITF